MNDLIQTRIERLPTPLLPAQIAEASYVALMKIAEHAEVPRSYAMQEVAKEIIRQSGIDLTKMLTQAKCMTDVPLGDVMLEPTELGAHFGLSGADANKRLCSAGLQTKQGNEWVATAAGKDLCVRHAWVSGHKSGYNLKWRFTSVESMFEETAGVELRYA